jgi:polysaccharide export outer membrane protein
MEKDKDIMVIEEPYILGSEDVVEVLVWKESDLSRVVTIRPDGMISLPLIGDIKASGLTVERLKENIRKKFENFVDNPTISIIIQEINSFKVFIQGEVARPGVYQLKSNTTLLQVISLAGGFTEWAKKDKIAIMRKAEDKEIRIPVNYDKILSGNDMSQNLLLKKRDVIIVP